MDNLPSYPAEDEKKKWMAQAMCCWLKIHLNVEKLPLYLFVPRITNYRTDQDVTAVFNRLCNCKPAIEPDQNSERDSEST